MARIYLDHAATTPLRREALDAMLPFLTEHQGNPGSPHSVGQTARIAVDGAREIVAASIGAHPDEIVFTASGSESISLALAGIAHLAMRRGKDHIVTCAIEHHAVLHAADALAARSGACVTVVPVGADGAASPAQLRDAITDRTALVSIAHANNEIGVVQPIAELAAIAHERGALFHTDAVQSAGHIPVDVARLGVDALSIAAHKFEGPKGVGALFIKRGVAIEPQILGGSQESNRRAGTENVPGIVGMAVALEYAVREMPAEAPRQAALRDRLIEQLCAHIPDAALCGPQPGGRRLPNNANVRFAGCDGSQVVVALDFEEIEVSTGSACTSGSLEPSHVLVALGLRGDDARGAVRCSLGRTTRTDDVEALLAILPGIVERLRAMTGAAAGEAR